MSNTRVTSTLTDHDIYLFKEGNHFRLYDKLGAHVVKRRKKGTHFAVWAPSAQSVSVVGDFNSWDREANRLAVRWDGSGIWEGFVPGVGTGALYKLHVVSRYYNYKIDKGDPFAFYWEQPPKTASVVWDLDYQWHDDKWMRNRSEHNALEKPISVYEIHLGSWLRNEVNGGLPNYRDAARKLVEYVREMGFTHVELLPIMEHPFYGSWGYQVVGYFAPTSRYGSPQDFMFLVDYLHQNGIGVILDWVPSHFPTDEYGLAYFDGTHLYEHADPREGLHPDWNSYIFNYGRNEVRNFLISSALFWLDKYHVDGIRVDAVASMLYRDYSRKDGEWIPNRFGGRENLEAIEFLKRLNETVYREYPDVQMIAEESTAWPMVSRPVYLGGLGFGMKWNMGWMHDTLIYFSRDSVHRKYHHDQLTFSIWYAFYENFVLSLSHDETTHGKGSLISKMAGDDWQRFANLRLLFGYMYAHPGKKLLFMGNEFAQWQEWSHDRGLDWQLLDYAPHKGIQKWVRDLNRTYRQERALHARDFEPDGFEWIDFGNWAESVTVFLRKSKRPGESVLVVCNFTPVSRYNYRIGVPSLGFWRELLNSDAQEYGGSGHGNFGGVKARSEPCHGQQHSAIITLPPLAVLFFKREKTSRENT
ncbi:glycogen branching protein [candidate division WOR_3 bacterium SM23_42]|uniref:1,4-alpha-glucan branching enzyme GlgB n=1 Tax=candidate division WOR_3 bacterium SM23_42 TaxID=1703779 RepID=A0A0S8FQL4_UNCW3|nr:MAG: glycogen branching protein [candidate division WOR_3 bacterium SM23_42]